MAEYKVKAIVDGQEIEDTVQAVNPHDAVDVFEVYHDCYGNGKQVEIENVEVVK